MCIRDLLVLVQPYDKMTVSTQKTFAWLGLAGIITSIALGIFSKISPQATFAFAGLSLVELIGAQTKNLALLTLPILAVLGSLLGALDTYSGGIPLYMFSIPESY